MASTAYKQRKPNVAAQPAKIELKKPATAEATAVDAQREAELEKLRQFDLDPTFGPCVGLSRMQRWERAQKNGLAPPQHVREIIVAHEQSPAYADNLFASFKSL